jgi:DNA-binding response OmpR family regulator
MARILIVEDNTDLLDILKLLLGRKHQVLAAERGEEGVELARSHRPDAVILDLMLPSMDGIETGLRIKQELGGDVSIMVLTALADPDGGESVLATGCCDAYMAKPATLGEIESRVEELLRSRHDR